MTVHSPKSSMKNLELKGSLVFAAVRPGSAVTLPSCNFTMHGVGSLAYDLIVRLGHVRSRVALLSSAVL